MGLAHLAPGAAPSWGLPMASVLIGLVACALMGILVPPFVGMFLTPKGLRVTRRGRTITHG